MKKVMILGANNFLLPLIKKSLEKKYYTIVVSPNEKEPGVAIADKFIKVNILDKDAVLQAAQEEQIDGIISDQAETPMRTMAYVAEKMGLNGIGQDKAELFTNKYLMREKCKEKGIRSVRYKLVLEREEALLFYKELGTIAIMKPVDSAGSRGVVRIENENDILQQFNYTQSCSRTGQVIIEEYIDGKELLIDGVVYDGEYQVLVCGEYKKCDIDGVFSEYIGKYPAEITEEQKKEVAEYCKTVIESFGLNWGRTHTEVKINDKGVYLIETAARGGGRYISSGIVPMLTDFSSEDFLLDACLGMIEKKPQIKYKNLSCGYVSLFLPVGEVISTEGLNDVINLPYTYSHNFEDIVVGFKSTEFRDKIEGRFIHVLAKDDKDFYNKVDEIKSIIKVQVKTERGIEGVIWES